MAICKIHANITHLDIELDGSFQARAIISEQGLEVSCFYSCRLSQREIIVSAIALISILLLMFMYPGNPFQQYMLHELGRELVIVHVVHY